MSSRDDEDEDLEPGFFAKYRVAIIAAIVVGLGAGSWFFFFKGEDKPKKKSSSSVTMITLPPPPPPPPATPPPTPPPQEQPPEQPQEVQQEFVEETQPDSAPEPEAPEEAPALGSNIQGEGNDGFGLRGKGGTGLIGGSGSGKTGGGGTKFGWYAGQVQSRVAEALRQHRKVRTSRLNLTVRIWADPSGRITRASLAQSTGDPELDRAIDKEVLTGLQLQGPPPEGMPMPIVMRITATRPN